VNDECEDAICVEDGVPVAASNVGATGIDIDSCAFLNDFDVWYVYTPSTTGSVTIDTCSFADFDTTLAVFDECGGSELACNDDFCGLSSTITMNMTAGEDYYIRLAGYNQQMGNTTLLVTGGDGTCGCGDIDEDGDVDVDDYNAFVDAFGSCIGDIKYNALADLDGDGCVTLVDFQAWVQCFRDANPNSPLPIRFGRFMQPSGGQGKGPAPQQAPGRP
jgi:hypothetical protein